MEQNSVQTADAKIEASRVVLGGMELWDNHIPNIEVLQVLQVLGIMLSKENNYVKAIEYLFNQGYRVDLDWRKEYDDEKSNQYWKPSELDIEFRDYRCIVHKKTIYKDQVNCTPFPIRTKPSGPFADVYKDSYVIKLSFRYEYEFENTMRAMYNQIQWGLVVIKAKKVAPIPYKKEPTFYETMKLNALKQKFNSKDISAKEMAKLSPHKG